MSVHGDAAAEAPSPRTTETGISRVTSLSDLARPRVRNRSALLVGFAVAVALFTLVAAAFSVAAESRVVASKSNQLHSYDEVLRCAITVRSQLGSALNFAQLDASQNTDSSAVIGSALTDASGCIAELQNSAGLEAGDDRAAEARLAFTTSSARVSELLVGGGEEDLVAARDLLIGPMNSEYEELIGALVDERQDLVDDLRQADENLGRLGALATFIIAFFVPTVAMFVYRQITRRQRETIELARLLSEARTGAEWRAELVRGAVRLANEETESLPASPLTSSLGTRLRDLEFLLGSTTLGQGYSFESLTVAEVRNEIKASWPRIVSVAGDGSDRLWGDRSAILLLGNDIVRNASRRGAERVLISGGLDADGVWLAITDNGRQLNQDAVKAILHTPSLIDAAEEHANRRLDDDTSLMLTLGRVIAPALGGSFRCENIGTNTRCTLRLPAARTRRTAAPTLTTAG